MQLNYIVGLYKNLNKADLDTEEIMSARHKCWHYVSRKVTEQHNSQLIE